MKRSDLILFLVLPWMILGLGKGREVQGGMSREGQRAEVSKRSETPAKAGEAKQVSHMEAETKGISMESARKKVGMKPREKVIRTVGRVNYDDKRIITVAPEIGGRIEDLYAGSSGRYVRQGEPLLGIYSAEMVAAQEEYLLALRAKDEFSKSPFPEVARSGESLAESAKRRLKLWHMSDGQIRTLEETRQAQKTLTVYAPESGYFLEGQAYKGEGDAGDSFQARGSFRGLGHFRYE